MAKKLGDRLNAITQSKIKARESDNISIDQFRQILGCETALTWLSDGQNLPEIYSRCDFILEHYCGNEIVYTTVKKVASMAILRK